MISLITDSARLTAGRAAVWAGRAGGGGVAGAVHTLSLSPSAMWLHRLQWDLLLQGAAQFGRDVQAVAALLAPYTRRPSAHFRELLDAATLLTLPADQVEVDSQAALHCYVWQSIAAYSMSFSQTARQSWLHQWLLWTQSTLDLMASPSTIAQAAEVGAALDSAPEAGLAAVRAAGAGRLTAQQARRVLSQRL